MKNLKSLFVLGVAAMTLAGCGEHQHTFAKEWSSDSHNHWHAATCEHKDEKSELAPHSFAGEWKSNQTYHWHECSVCGKVGGAGGHIDGNGDSKCDVCAADIPAPSDDKVRNVSGGSADEQAAIQKAAALQIVLLSGGTSMKIENVTDLQEDNGDYVKVTTQQVTKVNGKNYTVKFEYISDDTSSYYREKASIDANHDSFYFNYPGKGGAEAPISVIMSKASCGEAVSTDTGLAWNCNVKAATYFHKDVKIAELNEVKKDFVKAGVDGYACVDYVTKPENAYYTPNPENVGLEKQYYYVNCAGKMIYNAPDGNWGLIADGDQIMEVYAGSALDVLPSRYPQMNKGYVRVVGNMSQYLGNIQIGFVTDMKPATAADLDNEPTMNYAPITANDIFDITSGNHHKQCVSGLNLSNALKQVTGSFVPGSLLDKDGKATSTSSISAGARFSFKVDIGNGTQLTVAYDYHTDREGNLGVFNAVKSFLESGSTKTIKGTLRFSGNDSMPFNQTGGEWQLVPFLADHVA